MHRPRLTNLQVELLSKRNQRALELEAFKEKTRTLLKTFESQSREPVTEQQLSWLSTHTICVEIESIGVAFPLSFDQVLGLSKPASHGSSTVRAFLFSVRRIKFNTQRGEVGHVTSKELSLQFVDRLVHSSFFQLYQLIKILGSDSGYLLTLLLIITRPKIVCATHNSIFTFAPTHLSLSVVFGSLAMSVVLFGTSIHPFRSTSSP